MSTHARCIARIAALAMALPLTCAAHDFWLQPATFHAGAADAIPFTLQVGHGPYRQRSPIAARRIVRVAAIGPDGAPIDLRADLHLGEPASDGIARLPGTGTYVLALETDDRAQSHLPALRFNDYLDAEGLTPALRERARTRRTNANGSESYGRRAKAIVRIGDACVADPAPLAPLGMKLEIVIGTNPCALRSGDALPARVLYDGKPLEGALLKLTDLAHDADPVAMRRTARDGSAAFVVPQRGTWLLNAVWTTPLPESSETDFETIFSSLSFAVGE